MKPIDEETIDYLWIILDGFETVIVNRYVDVMGFHTDIDVINIFIPYLI